MKTLILEYDFSSRLFLQTFLSCYGEFHIAVDGREAVDAFRIAANNSIMPHGVPVNHLRHQFRILARQMDVRMLIIDEIHTMLAGSFCEQRVFLNSIPLLANDLKLPLVCVGTQEAKQALMIEYECDASKSNEPRREAHLHRIRCLFIKGSGSILVHLCRFSGISNR